MALDEQGGGMGVRFPAGSILDIECVDEILGRLTSGKSSLPKEKKTR